jgi:cob(I)alamin adenosyltransferase
MLDRGMVQIYTGDGKGKTTAAFGLALRAAGRGNRVLIYQFLKPGSLDLGERRALEQTDLPIKTEALDANWDMAASPGNEADIVRARAAIREALVRLTHLAAERAFDMIVLDEIAFCLARGLTPLAAIRRLIGQRHPAVELVLTGRDATPELMALADLVTEMRKVKHPFDCGVGAREGIDY